jgi:uncharacterized protein YdaU (DUF1376 family)
MKTSKKDPAFLFYPQDFLVGTYHMSNEQVGMYIRLLANQHQTGHLTEKLISKVCDGNIDEEVMAKFRIDSEGKWYNVKLDDEIARRKSDAERQRENANKRWKKDAKVDANKDASKDAMASANNIPRVETVTETVIGTYSLVAKSPLDDLYSDLSLEELVTTNTQTLANHNHQAPWEPKQF